MISTDFMRSRAVFSLRTGGIALAFLAGVFLSFPEIDLWFSKQFFDGRFDSSGKPVGFYLASLEELKFFFWLIDAIARVVLIVGIALLIYRAAKKHSQLLSTAIVVFSLIMGPAVVVNSVLKDHWDRARPRQVMEFGGDKKFTSALVISDQCARNCSFTSGHAAAGFAFIVGHFVTKGIFWLWLGIFSGLLVGFTRIIVGAHFLSDVLFSFFAVYLTSALVTLIFVRIASGKKAKK